MARLGTHAEAAAQCVGERPAATGQLDPAAAAAAQARSQHPAPRAGGCSEDREQEDHEEICFRHTAKKKAAPRSKSASRSRAAKSS